MIRRYELQQKRDGVWAPRGRYIFATTARFVRDALEPHAPAPLRIWDITKGEPIT